MWITIGLNCGFVVMNVVMITGRARFRLSEPPRADYDRDIAVYCLRDQH